MDSNGKIKVLIVDDSALIRQTLTKVLSAGTNIEVIGVANDPYVAVSKIKSEEPDVITLDIQMPKMDGLTFLRKIMTQHPIPVIIISSISTKDSDIALRAYKLGAIEVIEKPVMSSELLHKQWKEKLTNAIITAADSRVNKNILNSISRSAKKVDNIIKKVDKNNKCNSFILIGSSAGGTEVLNSIVLNLDADTSPLLIAQHMPAMFTGSFASRLNTNSQLEVTEAANGDELHRGMAVIAPGDQHMTMKNNGSNYFIHLNTAEKVNRHRPSVDVLFNSVLNYKGIKILAIILSGMGKDGSVSMYNLKEAGAITIAQNQESCVVYGMPKEAIRIGAATHSLSIDEIVVMIKQFSNNNS